MTKLVIASPRMFAIQNTLAALVFAGLLATQCLIYVLYLYPGTELVWALTIPANRIAGSLLGTLDLWIGRGPWYLIGILACAVAVPVAAQMRRSWLGTSIAGHVALAATVVLTYDALGRAQAGRNTADLSPIFDPAVFDPNSIGLAAAALILVGLCVLNHVVFLRRELK